MRIVEKASDGRQDILVAHHQAAVRLEEIEAAKWIVYSELQLERCSR